MKHTYIGLGVVRDGPRSGVAGWGVVSLAGDRDVSEGKAVQGVCTAGERPGGDRPMP